MIVNAPPIARLRSRAARRAIIAPDLSRYLDRRNVDLMVTDQVQALQVRVRRGLEVFEHRLADARAALRIGFAWRSGIFGAATFATVGLSQQLYSSNSEASPLLSIGLALGAILVLLAAVTVVRLLQDHRQLTILSGRCARIDLDTASTNDEVLAIADDVLGAATILGAVPPGK